MAPITLTSTYTPNETSIPNIFLDTFMPSASGEFVKVYLCLLRLFGDPNHKPATIADIADSLHHTEGDVIRAIKYWEKAGLLSVVYTDDSPVNITLLPLAQDKPRFKMQDKTPDIGQGKAPDTAAAHDGTEAASSLSPSVSADDENENIRQLLYVSQQLLGRTFNNRDMDIILYIYNDLHFSDELMEYLLEYCVYNEMCSLSYVQRVAISWHKEGITTVAQAKEHHEIHSLKAFSVMKAFGIGNRNPGKPELDYITRWYDEYGFSNELIIEACNRTIRSLHQPNFEYTDGILTNWKTMNLRTLADVEAADAARPKKDYTAGSNACHETSAGTKKPRAAAKNSNNRFNNFSQRNYDFDALEKQLIGKKN